MRSLVALVLLGTTTDVDACPRYRAPSAVERVVTDDAAVIALLILLLLVAVVRHMRTRAAVAATLK